MNSSDLRRLTFAYDPAHPDAVASAATLEARIVRKIKGLLTEGQSFSRSDRYRSGSNNRVDFFIPAEYEEALVKSIYEDIAGATSNGRSPGMSISSANVKFVNKSMTVLDAGVRAEIARKVAASGGRMSTNSDGVSTLVIPDKQRIRVDGRDRSLSRVISGMASNSNTKYMNDMNAALLAAGISDTAGMGFQEKSGILNERNMVYARLARRGRSRAFVKSYMKSHPKDPVVQDIKNSERRARSRKAVNSAKFVGASIRSGIASMLAATVTAIGLLKAIRDATLDLGDRQRATQDAGRSYNFSFDFMQQWKRFAEKRGLDQGILGTTAQSMIDKFSSPLLYTDANFSGIAPFLKEHTGELAGMAKEGSNTSVMGMMEKVFTVMLQNTVAGRSGTKSGLDFGQALSENSQALGRFLGPEASKLFLAYAYDAQRDGLDLKFGSWVRRGETDERYNTNRGGSGESGDATKEALALSTLAWKDAGATLKSLKDDVLAGILGNTSYLVEMLRSFLARKFSDLFPAWAQAEGERARVYNDTALSLANASLPAEKAAAEKAMRKYGYTGDPKDFADFAKSLKDSTAGKLAGDSDALYAVAKYLDTLDAIAFIQGQAEEDIPVKADYTGATSANRATRGASKLSRDIRVAQRLWAGKMADLSGSAGGTIEGSALLKYIQTGRKADLDEIIALADVNIAAADKLSWAPGSKAAKLDAMKQKILAYAYTPGKEYEMNGLLGEFRKIDSGWQYSDLQSRVFEIQDIRKSAISPLAARGDQARRLLALGDVGMLLTEVYGAMAKANITSAKSVQYDVDDNVGANGERYVTVRVTSDGKNFVEILRTKAFAWMKKDVTLPVVSDMASGLMQQYSPDKGGN